LVVLVEELLPDDNHVLLQDGDYKDGYILMQDPIIADAKSVSQAALSVKEFAAIIKRLKCREKTIILDVCHVDKPTVRKG